MCKVSVILTTCGRITINKAIKSVLDQTFQDWELIIVNDSGKPVCHPYSDARVRYIHNKNRMGGTRSLNEGIRGAQGEYIAILDDDDYWPDKNKLERQVNFLNDNLDYVACGCVKQEGQGDEIKANLIGTPFAHVSLMFRKGLEYDERLERAKDVDLFIRLNRLGRLKVLDNMQVSFDISNSLDKKIKDCYWQRKVCLLHKEMPDWLKVYISLWLRTLKLTYYKLTNGLRNYTGKKER